MSSMRREPAVVGRFYPANPVSLRRTIDSFLDRQKEPLEAKAIVSPHAGYLYSGAVAGAVYGSVKLPKRVIVLGPNHTGRGGQLALYPDGEWLTPLGTVSIDTEMNGRLLAECPLVREDHTAHAGEHSLEVQIPFLQALVPEFRLSAICVFTADYRSLESLGHALAKVIQSFDEPVLIVASSDMTHFESADAAAKKDKLAIDRVIAIDPRGLYDVVLEKDISMCGFAPTVAALTACRDLGASTGRLIRYADSGDITGDKSDVVAYAGIAIV